MLFITVIIKTKISRNLRNLNLIINTTIKADKSYCVRTVRNNFWTQQKMSLNRHKTGKNYSSVTKTEVGQKVLPELQFTVKALVDHFYYIRLIPHIRNFDIIYPDFFISPSNRKADVKLTISRRSDEIPSFIIQNCSEIFNPFLCYIFIRGLLKTVFHLRGMERFW
jgi:hypothetical protein